MEKFSRKSPDATFSQLFTKRFPENTRKCRGNSRGEIFPSGSFPDFPKFSRREIFSTKFRHNITNNLYTYNCLQPVNQTFVKFVALHFRKKFLQENFPDKKVSRHFPRKFCGKFSPGKFPPVLWKHRGWPTVETFRVRYIHYVYNTRLESVFIEKYSILSYKTHTEILPSGSFPHFPKFSWGNFLHKVSSPR